MTLEELVSGYLEFRAPGWLVLGEDEAINCAINAARFYAGYGPLVSIDSLPNACFKRLDRDLKVTPSEWAVIGPLFVLYLEFENSQRLEASRSSGLDAWGRSTDAIKGDIKETEADIVAGKGFVFPVQVLGIDGTDTLPIVPDVATPLAVYLSLLFPR